MTCCRSFSERMLSCAKCVMPFKWRRVARIAEDTSITFNPPAIHCFDKRLCQFFSFGLFEEVVLECSDVAKNFDIS